LTWLTSQLGEQPLPQADEISDEELERIMREILAEADRIIAEQGGADPSGRPAA
jgi:hypothetical protein